MEKQGKRLVFNTISSLGYQIVAIVCGLILPRLILQSFGSNVNGLVNSIAQFLGIISFLDLGVGAVIQSSLYKPLAEKDNEGISKIIVSGGKFFRRIAYILSGYIVILTIVYPFINDSDFDFLFTALLILSMGISSFAQYYFGVVDRLLLSADQRGYIQYNAQTITLILNTIACVFLIKLGASIQIVKLVTSLIFLLRPIVLRIYVNKHYSINRKIKYEGEPIKQKWNGMAQHIAAVVLDGTDTIVLTVFSSLANVSIYSVYHLVVNSVKTLFTSLTNGIHSLMGELWAKQDVARLREFFRKVQWMLHTGTIFIFGCTVLLIVPFVQVYTKSITDTNYIQPLFAVLITAANAGHCLRLPYNIVILAAGDYKNTQRCYIVATLLNIIISIICVFFLGLIGVAIGTLVAMVYQTIWMAIYNSKHLIKGEIKSFIKQIFVDIIMITLMWLATSWIKLESVTWITWIFMALKVAGISFLVVIVVNLIFYRNEFLSIIKSLKKSKVKY
ncbi:MAG: hypothetical protein SPH68_00885 [Candidatus Borkfalkiaceae bacterium]|nr:sugar isomerase [Clostridia bacterium]MDY6222700.1 hypothetical protein [Christensenellaceae bacterium]